jgi:mannose-6-phosphate isomerase-like protein (cupin superfamily)
MEPKILNEQDLPWGPHRSFPRVHTKPVLGKAQQPAFSVLRVRVEPGAEISTHIHEAASETVYILAGSGCFLSADGDVPCTQGSVCLAPIGYTHGVRNTGSEALEILAIFSPPLA